MSPIEHEQHIGYDRFTDNVERAEAFLADAVGAAAELWARVALGQLDEAVALLADEGPRGIGASRADYYRLVRGLPTAADLRERASMILYGAAEASAITGGLVEERDA